MKIKRCVVCQTDMPEYWQKMSDDDVKNLARALGIRPVCHDCFVKALFRLCGQVKP